MRRISRTAVIVAAASHACWRWPRERPRRRPGRRPPSATIHPGVQTVTDGAQCTANFVFQDAANYLGQAAHCSGTGGRPTPTAALGVAADRHAGDITGASKPGRSSTTRGSRCRRSARPTPTPAPSTTSRSSRSTRPTSGRSTRRSRSGAARPGSTARPAPGDKVLTYGNSELRGGITQLSPKEGDSLGDDGGGWTHTVYTVTPGIPGDSGSAFLDRPGRRSASWTVAIAPLAGTNGVGDITKELAYLAAHTSSRHAGERHRAFPGARSAGLELRGRHAAAPTRPSATAGAAGAGEQPGESGHQRSRRRARPAPS